MGELTALVASDATPGMLRRDAAVALGQVGEARPEVIRALNLALFDRDHRVQAGAAHGLSLLGTADAARRLLGELKRADTTGEIRRITEPLGYFADPNVADPEPRPSLGVLGRHANYPAGTQSLMAAILAR